MTEWMSVEDGFPDEAQEVLAYFPNYGVRLSVFLTVRGKPTFGMGGHEYIGCTHWQPIPNPPIGD